LGEGTTVELLIPKATDSQPAENAGASDTQPRSMIPEDETGSGARVLLVEDNEEVAAGIMAVLEVFGCEVRHEFNASDALEALSTGQRFDLVLSDIQMPGPLNGLDLAEKIRRERPQLNIALMTGYADQLERARILGITILAKPFDMDSLKLLVTLSEDGPTRTKGAVDADATRP
jgi:CheY-like chemotaxis protein